MEKAFNPELKNQAYLENKPARSSALNFTNMGFPFKDTQGILQSIKFRIRVSDSKTSSTTPDLMAIFPAILRYI
jgi:hypothetical protein